MQNCLQRDYKQFYLNARCVQGRCFTCTHRNWHSWQALLDLMNLWTAEMWFPFYPADLCPKAPHTHHWWVTVRLLFQARYVGEQFCCNHTGFCQWIREMCEQIHCLFVHQTALAHRAPHCWKVISLQRMYQLFQWKAILSVNCKKDSLIAKKKIPFPCCLYPPPLPQPPLFFLSQMLLFLFGLNPLLTYFAFQSKSWDSWWCFFIHGIWNSFSPNPWEHSSSPPALLNHITMENDFLSPSFLLSPHSCFSSPSTSSRKCQVLCALYGTPKGSDMSNQIQNFRLLFVHVTLCNNDLPKLLLPVHRQGSSGMWLGDDLRDQLFISMLVESKIWQKA